MHEFGHTLEPRPRWRGRLQQQAELPQRHELRHRRGPRADRERAPCRRSAACPAAATSRASPGDAERGESARAGRVRALGLGLGFNWNGGAQTGGPAALHDGVELPPGQRANVSANINGDFNDTNNDGTQDAGETSILTALPGYDDWNASSTTSAPRATSTSGTVRRSQARRILRRWRRPRGPGGGRARPCSRSTWSGLPTRSRRQPDLLAGRGEHGARAGARHRADRHEARRDDGSVRARHRRHRRALPRARSATPSRAPRRTAPCSRPRPARRARTCPATSSSASDAVTTTVHAPVLTLAKAATASVNAGEAITYRVTYGNSGAARPTPSSSRHAAGRRLLQRRARPRRRAEADHGRPERRRDDDAHVERRRARGQVRDRDGRVHGPPGPARPRRGPRSQTPRGSRTPTRTADVFAGVTASRTTTITECRRHGTRCPRGTGGHIRKSGRARSGPASRRRTSGTTAPTARPRTAR